MLEKIDNFYLFMRAIIKYICRYGIVVVSIMPKYYRVLRGRILLIRIISEAKNNIENDIEIEVMKVEKCCFYNSQLCLGTGASREAVRRVVSDKIGKDGEGN